MAEIPLVQEDWLWEEMAENTLLFSVAFLANVHFCEEAAAVSQCLEAVCQLM